MAAPERLKLNFDRWAEHLRKQAPVVKQEIKAAEPLPVGAVEQKPAEMPQVIKQKIPSTRPTYQRPTG